MVAFIFRENLPCGFLVFRDDHKAHVRIDFLHIGDGVEPVAAVQIQLRVTGVFAAPHVDDAQIICGILVGFILGLHLQPLPDLFDVAAEVALVLQISVQEGPVTDSVDPLVGTADVAAVLHVVAGVPHEEAVVLLVEAGIVFHFVTRNFRAEIKIHEVHASVGLGNIADLLRVDGSEVIAEIFGNAAGGNKEEKLIPESVPGNEFYADHAVRSPSRVVGVMVSLATL